MPNSENGSLEFFESFYRSSKFAKQFGPMADLMKPLLAELERRGLTASTSHHFFFIRLSPAYPDGDKGNHICIWPEHTGKARIIFIDAESKNPSLDDIRHQGELVPYRSAIAYLQPLLDRL
ncbi:MAG TPA: hypothetical protein VGE67_12755 [Haloferula sp.]